MMSSVSTVRQNNALHAALVNKKVIARAFNITRAFIGSTVLLLLIGLLPTTIVHAATYFYHNDHLGTPQALTDANQQVVWQSVQEPFGEVEETTNQVEQNLRFPG